MRPMALRGVKAWRLCVAAAVASCVLLVVGATDNGFPNSIGVTPPMGWRSWNCFELDIDQGKMMAQLDAITAERRPTWEGGPARSLLSLGYNRIGLDEGWECMGCGVNGGFHNAKGEPLVNLTRFPDMKGMTSAAHARNVSVDFYLNNCSPSKETVPHYVGDVNALLEYGFDGTKIDGCGPAPNVTRYAELLNASGRALLLEDCNDGGTKGSEDWCPFNTFRTTNDIAPQFLSTMSNLNGNQAFENVTRPGCFPQPDMLEVGTSFPHGAGPRALSFVESKTHFSAWCIVSAPLILGFDMSNSTTFHAVWPIISNTEAIAINQAPWAGDGGRLVASSPKTFTGVVYNGAGRDLQRNETLPQWQIWSKRLLGGNVAALAVNLYDQPLTEADGVGASFEQLGLPAGTQDVAVRDLWTHTGNGTLPGVRWSVPYLSPHDSVFVVLTPLR